MITLIIESYLTILLSIGASAFVLLIAGMYLIIRQHVTPQDKKQAAMKAENQMSQAETVDTSISALVELTKPSYADMSAIAGEDVTATQLDLARALIETGKNAAAKDILHIVIAKGSEPQQREAKRLLLR